VKQIFLPSRSAELRFCQFLSSALGQHVPTLPAALSLLKQRQAEILSEPNLATVPPLFVSGAFLARLCEEVRVFIPEFSSKRIIYLLDDFSLPKIPRQVQQALLPTIWNSGGGYTFRVTAHSESVEISDVRKNVYSPNREYREINLGALYINSVDLEQKEEIVQSCVQDIFQRRFELSSSTVPFNLRKLLGRSTPNIAAEIRERLLSNKLRGLRFHGWETAIALCSGDISYLIDVLGKMLQFESPSTRASTIKKQAQNRVIRHYAKTELYRLQDFPSTQCNLYEVALNFGKISRFKLERTQVRETSGNRPAEYLRIEVQVQNISEDVRAAIAELLRNGVFIDGGFSSSSQGIPARRLIFKKLFTPAFPTTYRSRDTFPMTAQHFEEFVKNPGAGARRLLGEAGIKPNEQQLTLDSLFDLTS
jgi:hypothetical protein